MGATLSDGNTSLNFPMSMSCPSVILNSLTHQDFVPRSLSLLDAAGRFVELAKLQAMDLVFWESCGFIVIHIS